MHCSVSLAGLNRLTNGKTWCKCFTKAQPAMHGLRCDSGGSTGVCCDNVLHPVGEWGVAWGVANMPAGVQTTHADIKCPRQNMWLSA